MLFLHHLNKQGHPRGSQAFRGVVDIEMRLYKGRSHSFRIESMSRFATGMAPKLGGKLVENPTGWFYQVLDGGDAAREAAKVETTDARLWKALVEAGPTGITYYEIDQVDGLSEDIAKKRFRHWFPERVGRHGKGTKRDPYRWFALAT